MISLYLRTITGDYYGTFDDEESFDRCWKTNTVIPVETVSGYKCKIPAGDVRTWGDRAAFEKIAKELAHPDKVTLPADWRFGFIKEGGGDEYIGIYFRYEGGEKLATKMTLDTFIDRFIKELPNTVTDAILDEKERRNYS